MNRIFIIHSHEDYQLVGALVHLIKNSFYDINRKNIICSSQIRQTPLKKNSNSIRKYLSSVELTLGLLTEHSKMAPGVLFELGAAWNSNQLITLLGDKIDQEQIPAPLKEHKAQRLDNKSALWGLLNKIAQICGYGEKKPSGIDEVIDIFLNGYPYAQSFQEPQEWSFLNWSTWGGLKAKVSSFNPSEVVLNGTAGAAAGLVAKSQLGWEQKILKLDVKGSSQSDFSRKKMFKLQINQEPLRPLEHAFSNPADPEYLRLGDNSFRFQLPGYINDIELVFYGVKLNNLKIRGVIE